MAVVRGSTDDSAILTPTRLRRLQRDRDRQTVRWTNFETRVQSVPDSQQRGFELALYYAITHDQARGREAIDWGLTHPCNPMQTPHILDWTGDLLTDAQRAKFPPCKPVPTPGEIITRLENGAFREPSTLFLYCQYLIAYRATEPTDPRRAAPQFFTHLPVEFLLSLVPTEVEHPSFLNHLAALTLVALDPNLEASQYLQAWAIEDRHMLRDGPGVAHEFFWADPYLPGVGYQNLDPWIYDPAGRLFARTNWDPDSCWIGLYPGAVEERNCPPGWRDHPAHFGHLTLIPITARCADLPRPAPGEIQILWRLNPHEPVSYRDGKQQHSANADAAGILQLSAAAESKVCRAR